MSSTITGRVWVGAIVFTFVASIASAQTKPYTSGNSTDQQVRAAQEQMLRAAIQGDKEAFSKFLSDDVTWVAMNGQVEGKDQVLAALPAPVHTVEVQQVLPMGKTAILVALVHLKDGTDRRALQEWVNRNGEWKVMAHESTPIRAEGTTAGTMGAAPTGTSGGTASEARTVEPALNSDDERAVWRAQTEMVDAYCKGDTNRYSRLTATPFARIETNGRVYNRRQWLELVAKNAKQPLKPGAMSDVQVRVENDVARVTMQLVPFNADGTMGSPERQTRVFVLRNGQWQQVAAISLPIAQQ